ncbi:recombinase family protein [Pelagovum sp. HNIBRBA483]|uniref:recombinase family protein n=1 Tax=Pelagovum sp. HNIBRBA483 TaxID=3233341 RepID=UPI0034A5747F
MLIGYARTSTVDQDYGLEAQKDELQAYGIGELYHEKVSAVDSNRAELKSAIKSLRKGDKLVVTKLDRLARSVRHLGELLESLEAKGAGLVVLSMGGQQVDTTTATGKLILTMLGSVAEFERNLMKERQKAGIEKAKAQGKYKGRIPTAKRQADKVLALKEAGVSRQQIMEQLGISQASYYRIVAST